MPNVSVTSQLYHPTTGKGVMLSSLAVEVLNALLQKQDELVYPAGITQTLEDDSYTYSIADYLVDPEDAGVSYPGTHGFFKFIGQFGGNTYTWFEQFSFGAGFSPTVPDGREPYADMAYATSYMQTRMEWEDWERLTGLDAGRSLRALVTASDDIDTEMFIGSRLTFYALEWTHGQRQFPRAMGSDQPYNVFASLLELIPPEVKQACVVQALFRLRQEEVGNDWQSRMNMQAQGLTGVQIGRSSESFDLARATQQNICVEARQLLRPWLAVTGRSFPR